MRRLLLLCLAFSLLPRTLSTQQETAVTNAPSSHISNGAEGESKSPFDLSFGPQADGHFGAVLKGGQYYPLSGVSAATWDTTQKNLLSPFIGVQLDASWNSAPDALNHAAVSLRPSLGISRIRRRPVEVPGREIVASAPTTSGPWLHLYADFRQRRGQFEEEGADDPVEVDQTILGGGAEFRWSSFNEWYRRALKSWGTETGREDEAPSLSLTYYTVRNTTSDVALPDDITADALQARLRTSVTLPIQCSTKEVPATSDPGDPFGNIPGRIITCPWGFMADVIGTKPTKGDNLDIQALYDFGIYFDAGGKFKPIVRLRSGEEHGFEFDRQFILGVLWELGK